MFYVSYMSAIGEAVKSLIKSHGMKPTDLHMNNVCILIELQSLTHPKAAGSYLIKS